VRVAALYDIHGNLPALEAVLREVEAEDVDAIVFGGDVVGGPFSAEVFDRATGIPGARVIRGNADRTVLEGETEFGIDWAAERERLGDSRLAAITSWPLTVELEVDGLGRVLFCHAIPTADEPIFTRITTDEDVERLLGDTGSNVVVVGHTHVQFDRVLANGVRVVNAGSVGMPYEGLPGAYWALLAPDVELRRTEYDVEAAVASIREARGTADEDTLVRYLLDPPDPDDATAFFESQRKEVRGA
jgi:putative phosphoesterase